MKVVEIDLVKDLNFHVNDIFLRQSSIKLAFFWLASVRLPVNAAELLAATRQQCENMPTFCHRYHLEKLYLIQCWHSLCLSIVLKLLKIAGPFTSIMLGVNQKKYTLFFLMHN